MTAKVADLMTAPAHTVAPEDSLFHAAELMWGADCGGLPVVAADGTLAGFVTDRDIAMCAAIQGRTLHEMPVSAAMTFGAESVGVKDDLAAAHGKLRARRVHRLPVIDAAGAVVGLLSLADLVRDAHAHPKARSSQTEVRATVSSLAEPWDDASPEGGRGVTLPAADAAPSQPTRKPATRSVTKPAAKTSATRKHVKKAEPKSKTVRSASITRKAAGSGSTRGKRAGGGRSASAGA